MEPGYKPYRQALKSHLCETSSHIQDWGRINGMTVLSDGTIVACCADHCIRILTTSGLQSVFAGKPGHAGKENGEASCARFNNPFGIAQTYTGEFVVTDSDNHRVCLVSTIGKVSDISGSGTAGYADGTGQDAQFNNPTYVAVADNNSFYVVDEANHRIRSITLDGKTTTALKMDFLGSIATLSDGSLVIADTDRLLRLIRGRIEKITGSCHSSKFNFFRFLDSVELVTAGGNDDIVFFEGSDYNALKIVRGKNVQHIISVDKNFIATALVITPEGKILLTGYSTDGDNHQNRLFSVDAGLKPRTTMVIEKYERGTALALAHVKRLGRDSHLSIMPADLLRIILELSMAKHSIHEHSMSENYDPLEHFTDQDSDTDDSDWSDG